jgi:hypothetical protein
MNSLNLPGGISEEKHNEPFVLVSTDDGWRFQPPRLNIRPFLIARPKTIADVLGEEGFARSPTAVDLECLFAGD